MDTIPVVFAANDTYAPYLGVAMHSLIRRMSDKHQYKIYVLETEISTAHKQQIVGLQKKNVLIEFKNISDMSVLRNISSVNHLSQETAYRLLIPQIFPEYKKILYLDSDIVVLRDVAALYEEDIDGCAVACARAWLLPDLAKYIKNSLRLPIEGYFNPGVMLMNIPLFSRLDIGSKGLAMLSKQKYFTQDQDVLNLLCSGHVKYLNPGWNVEWGHATGLLGNAVIDESRQGQLESMGNPFIVHYATCCKPWVHPELPLAEYFWQEARETVFYEEILMRNSHAAAKEADVFRWCIFPWELVRPHSRVVLYGGGEVGKAFCMQLRKTRYGHVVAVCDKKAKNLQGIPVPVVSPDILASWDEKLYDAVLIAVKRKSIAMEIQGELLGLGIPQEKIRWKNPLRPEIVEPMKEE